MFASLCFAPASRSHCCRLQVLFEILVIVIQLLVASLYAGSLRKTVFTKEFFEKNFPELKGNYPKGGYPDMGTGQSVLHCHCWRAVFLSLSRLAHQLSLSASLTSLHCQIRSKAAVGPVARSESSETDAETDPGRPLQSAGDSLPFP